MNALADEAPGFVWRLQTDAGDATSIHVFDDDLIIVNMSVWNSITPLGYVYSGGHLAVLRRREWFEVAAAAHRAVVDPASIPTGIDRLATIRQRGPAPAFTFKQPPRP